LIRVIDRRKGLPVALGILYIHTAQTQGWNVCGINFPGHFLLRLDWGGERCLLDPFTGKLLNDASDLRALLKAGLGADAELEQQHYASVGTRETLFRLQNNIKLRLMRRHQIQRALRVVETLLLVAPEQTGLLRESGFLNAHLGNLQSAVDSLQMFLNTASTDPSTRYEVAAVLQDLKTRLD
ncbi:MAG: tetratricopeptide repeat protein, partial [Pseudomonadota bacterium]